LEKLASRLSHELRTPVAVVRSSLENINLNEISGENLKILHRADTGILRLQTILNRMGEASRLEQSIDDTQLESFKVDEFLNNLVEGYKVVYPENIFSLTSASVIIRASKDLIAQALDKLISNAVSFCDPGAPIEVELTSSKKYWQLSIYNQGPSLPKGMEQQLFQSMVSIRQKNSKEQQPHLGLGLHIVRLIAEFHGGEVSANNHNNGVCFTLKIPFVPRS